jgi:aminoglycoside phosphotransferase (APT) family kinase protein
LGIAAVLDWEFAASGSPLVDLGNFLRFEHEMPRDFTEAFIQGYVAASEGLPSNWRELAKLLDLAAMVHFLERDIDSPKTFRTAISVIQKTIEHEDTRFDDHLS